MLTSSYVHRYLHRRAAPLARGQRGHAPLGAIMRAAEDGAVRGLDAERAPLGLDPLPQAGEARAHGDAQAPEEHVGGARAEVLVDALGARRPGLAPRAAAGVAVARHD